MIDSRLGWRPEAQRQQHDGERQRLPLRVLRWRELQPTCDLPAATIEVGKGDPVVDGDVNEEPVQASLADDGNAFRVVDCKYQYILSIPSLTGPGTYEVQIWIDGVRVPTPASPGGK